MKPIIVDMKDISDSTEVYDSKPNRFMIYTIYVVLAIFAISIIWMGVSKIEIVVKSNGIFRGSNAIYEISSAVTGRVKKNNVLDGQYVREGDTLYVLNIDTLSDTIIRYQDELEAATDRLEILSSYEKSLGGDIKELDSCADNLYYNEFTNRRKRLYANMTLSESDTNGQVELYQGSADSISGTIDKYNEKINKLNAAKQCIKAQNNTLDSADSYYYSMVSSYLASYNYTTFKYDNQINEYQKQIDTYEVQIRKAEEENTSNETVSSNEVVVGNEVNNVEVLKKQRDVLNISIESVKKEKMQSLLSLELQQITAIEQQISEYNDTILSMEANLISTRLQLESIRDSDNETKSSVAILTEKGNVAAEILSYQEKKKECESYLKSYDIQNDNCTIRANVSGYYYSTQNLKTGTYVQEGVAIGTIYPERESKYYAEICVENSDIAKVKEGQEVKFEIEAYPSKEYGYFTGVVENIARDISIDKSTGYPYYLVKIRCDHMTVKNDDGVEASLINGMACQAKIVVYEQNVLKYLLEKIDLLD